MEVGKLEVDHRSEQGKGAARRLRAKGLIPGICYGHGRDPLPIALNAKNLQKALDPQKRHNTVIAMTVNGDKAKAQSLTVMLKDYQIDPLRRDVRHADFVVVDLTKEVHVTVPLVLTGKPEGVKDGGILHAVFRELSIASLPDAIPIKIEVDVSALKIGESVHVRDLKLPKGVRALLGPEQTIATVTAPQVEKTPEEEAAAAGVEGAAPAEGAAAAPAAGAAGASAAAGAAGAAAKGAAPAKAGGGGKEEKKGK
jgi:large subunit ribosomal protein L25